MNAYPASLDAMLVVWNLTDLTDLRAQLEAILTPDVVFIDPSIELQGIAAFERNVRNFRAKYPNAVLRKTSAIDSHHQLHRYSWNISVQGKIILIGLDVTETDAHGLVKRVLGFFGPLKNTDA